MRSGSANESGAMLATPSVASHCCHSPIAFNPSPDEPCRKTTTGTRALPAGASANLPANTAPPVAAAGSTTAA